MITSSPGWSPSRPSATEESTSSQASGAPSEPCLGASARVLIVDRITPIGRSCAGSASAFARVFARLAFIFFVIMESALAACFHPSANGEREVEEVNEVEEVKDVNESSLV